MKHRFWFTLILGLLLTACAQAREILVTLAYNNLSDSYIHPFEIRVNGKAGIPVSTIGCSEGVSTAGLASASLREPPRFVTVTWEHMLIRKVYRARINLSDKAGKWWRQTPFRDENGKPVSTRPVLVIQWRGPKQVAAMLVANFTDFSKGTMDLGIAEGKEAERPNWGPKLYLGYDDFLRKPGDEYRPGAVAQYQRRYDKILSSQQRFGCPRLPNGRVDTSRLPPEKLPYLVGANGEHIPCAEYFCRDKQELIKKLRKLGWREYREGQDIPAIEFGDAPNPEPAR